MLQLTPALAKVIYITYFLLKRGINYLKFLLLQLALAKVIHTTRNIKLMVLIFLGQCRNLQDLNLSECVGVNDDVMRDILEGCSILLYLNISFTNITDATLRLLAK